MKTKLLTLILATFLFQISFGQDQMKYAEHIKEAFKHYEAKEYKKSAEKYKEAFDELDGKAFPRDRYNAACSFALAEDIESSFYHLFKLAESPKGKYKNYNHISADTDLTALHQDERWEKLMEIVKANQEEAEKYLDKDLVSQLKTIRVEYLKNRHLVPQIEAFEAKNGKGTEEMKVHWAKINQSDSANLSEVKKILDERGWLGSKIVGEQGNHTFFLIIQLADLQTQLHYLPMMRKAVSEGNAMANSLAIFEDEVAMQQGNRQIYGTQLAKDDETEAYYVLPIQDPEHVDQRRSEIGLEPLAEYISKWGVVWDVEKHKEQTIKLESKEE